MRRNQPVLPSARHEDSPPPRTAFKATTPRSWGTALKPTRASSTAVPEQQLRSTIFACRPLWKNVQQRGNPIASRLYSRIATAIHKRVAKRIGYCARVNGGYVRGGHFLSLQIERRIHLTFDDGPHLVNTPKLLDELKQAGILATFFVVGRNLETPHGKELIQRAADEGHQIGNHTYSHPHLTELSKDQIREEIIKTEKLIGDTNKGIKIFRPPYGEHNSLVDRVARELGYSLVFWTVDPLDWHPEHKRRWVDHAMEQIVTQDDIVVLAHDVHTTTVANVGSLIANIRKLCGSRFIRHSEAFPRKRSLPSLSHLRMLLRQSGEI